ncbi:MAG: hypothetical protein ACI9N9_000901 [Enterobacterales bacterium]|jgi:hypothetical protein
MFPIKQYQNKLYNVVVPLGGCVAAYLIVLAVVETNSHEDLVSIFQQLCVVILVGTNAICGYSIFCWCRGKIKNRWLLKLGFIELFKICNDTTKKVNAEICDLLSPKENTRESSESLFLGERTECFVFSYGLVLIGMTRHDNKFLNSSRFEELHARILRRIVDISKEKYSTMNLDMNLVESQLTKSKMKELENVMLGVQFYKEQSVLSKPDPLRSLVNTIAERSYMKEPDSLRRLTVISNRILNEVDDLILSYR